MPAAAVIPAPKAYIKFVAVKKLIVGSEDWLQRGVSPHGRFLPCGSSVVLDPRWLP